GPDIRSVMTTRLAKCHKELNALAHDIDQLSRDPRSHPQRLAKLTARWNRTMQRLLSMGSMEDWQKEAGQAAQKGARYRPTLSLLTAKPFKDHWNASALAVGLAHPAMHYIGNKPALIDERGRKGPVSLTGGSSLVANFVDTAALAAGDRAFPLSFGKREHYAADPAQITDFNHMLRIELVGNRALLTSDEYRQVNDDVQRELAGKKFHTKAEFDRALGRAMQNAPTTLVRPGATQTVRGVMEAHLSKGSRHFEPVDSFKNLTPALADHTMKSIWSSVHDAGGAGMTTKYHALHVKAVIGSDGERKFLIQDPKHEAVHQQLSLEQMKDMLTTKGMWRSDAAQLLIDTANQNQRDELIALDTAINGAL
ncbi:MAG: hypothetical protein AAFY56_10890, partial [Pseudomonadota bacterium]